MLDRRMHASKMKVWIAGFQQGDTAYSSLFAASRREEEEGAKRGIKERGRGVGREQR